MTKFYKGCTISKSDYAPADEPFVWEDTVYGMESDDSFATVEDAKADIDAQFPHGNFTVIDNEIQF